MQQRVRAVFMRGGTSRGLFFRGEWLPPDQRDWAPIFLAALGSPDPYGRQLDGLGGGISSLSKVMVVQPARRTDADVDYTFGQVAVGDAAVEYRTNCGNLTSAVACFAVDEGYVRGAQPGHTVRVRMFNTNTQKLVLANVLIDEHGRAATDGDFALQGVAGTGAPIRLEFRDPGGAVTGSLLPTAAPCDTLEVEDVGLVEASLVDATTAAVFVDARALGLSGTELPDALEADRALLERLEAIRAAAAVRLALAKTAAEASERSRSSPVIALLAPPSDARTLAGEPIAAADADITARVLSMGRPHRAIPLTLGMCLAVAMRIEGTLAQRLARTGAGTLRIAHPSGVLPVDAAVKRGADGAWTAESAVVFRTARRLMEGDVLVPASRLAQLAEATQ